MAPAIGPPPLLASSLASTTSSVSRGAPGPCDWCDSCWCSRSARVGADPPNNAVPTRTSVAPAATAASRSPLMPADSSTASGWSARTRSASAASAAKAGAGSRRAGPPPSARAAAAGGARDRVGQRRARRRPPRRPRAAARPPGPPRSTWSSTSTGRAASPGRPGRGRRPGTPVHGVHHRAEPGDRGGLVALQLADEVPAQRQVGERRRLADSSWARFSPKSGCPSAARPARPRPARSCSPRAARPRRVPPGRRGGGAIRSRTARRFSSAEVGRQPPRARLSRARRGRPAGRSPRRGGGRTACGSSTVQRGSCTTSGDAGPASSLGQPGAQVQPGGAAAGARRRPPARARPPRPASPPAPRSRRRTPPGPSSASRAAPGPPGSPWRDSAAGHHARRTPSRPGVHRGDHPGAGSASSTGTQSATSTHEHQPGRRGDQRVGRRHRPRPRPVDDGDAGAVHLLHPDQPVLGARPSSRATRPRFAATAAGSSPTWSPRLNDSYGRDRPPRRSVTTLRGRTAAERPVDGTRRASAVEHHGRDALPLEELGDVELLLEVLVGQRTPAARPDPGSAAAAGR